MSDRVGQQIGNYRLVRLLGCGGFACVYHGQHRDINKEVAIKILHDTVSQNGQNNFLLEAENLESLNHPHSGINRDFHILPNLLLTRRRQL
jgi:eukaryotic-like serine/threonine-protein kinase